MAAGHRSRRSPSRRRQLINGAVATALAAASVAGCDAGEEPASAPVSQDEDQRPVSVPPVRVGTNIDDLRAADIGKPLRIQATQGTLRDVTLETGDGTALTGKLDGGAWELSSRLEPGTDYVATARAERTDGEVVTRVVRFHTEDLTLDQQTYPSVAPLAGETVGVGMPVMVRFDVAVADKAAFERHMTVTSAPAQPGAWHWFSDHLVHWRPRTYWQAGTEVTVDLDLNSIDAGNGVHGQESRTVEFHVGDANIYKVNALTHQMQVFSNAKLLRTIPITTGKEGFTTRSGTKVIMEKFETKRMNSETVGIASDNPEAYDIDDVRWAMRLTHSGEFIHAAPWSVSSQGLANVSHGCTGMSTADAAWLYAMSRRGDVVEYTGTDVAMTLDNGYGDWNASFGDYKAGSALS
ncbi:MAG: ErfK/YbiS/YcfS/YnhG family protein [Nocardioides sp.]|jgi:lipoprotein-anchoring transpeptidase ErfK/SrfK|uniref:L,D-transpeptidase n=1 Tax=Nocardioides sp. TaxID=35761 RepID=UPI00261E7EFD|nr:Ig-like domain-containing protein [Nocardioides sp.]MCW2833020.1 ErfK/YbiS/YcfS/YnhG family protein [Nocardioides sp.]